MKILQIVADGNPGGGTTFVLELMGDGVLLTQKGSYAAKLTSGYEIDFFTSRLDLRIALKMNKVIDEIKPELIHVHGGRAAFFLSFCKKVCPIIYTVHGLHGIYQGLRFSKWGERRAMQKADLVTFVSHAEEELALKCNLLRGTSHCVIPNGIDPKKLPTRKKPKPKLLGFIGRLCDQKDPLFLLKVMEILGPMGYHLRVIGGGEYEEAMKQSPHVTVTGKLPRKEALEKLADIETLLVPSRWEAFGLVLLEAMALEIPIIASKIPPFEEVLGSFGTLIDEKDPQKYVDAVLAGADYTQAAKERFEKHYLWEQCANSYHSIFRDFKIESCYTGG